ncbi:MAG: hypothetical protein II921_10445 [Treponema sp.]|nr:hypothetical protein [Treponema sp.]
MKSSELSILVYSCWKNRDMWDTFLPLFKKYWPDCAFQLVLLTDKLECDESRYAFDKIIALDGSWHEMITNALSECKTQFVMLFMDDYLFWGKMENEPIESFVSAMKTYDAANIRFTKSAFTKLVDFAPDARFKQVVPGSAYSLSTQIGIWNAEILRSYMNKEWSAWDFERIGSLEIKDFSHPILETVDFRIPYSEGVRKGKWLPDGIKVCEANGVKIDFARRPKMGFVDYFIVNAKTRILKLNPNLVQKMQNLLQKR